MYMIHNSSRCITQNALYIFDANAEFCAYILQARYSMSKATVPQGPFFICRVYFAEDIEFPLLALNTCEMWQICTAREVFIKWESTKRN